MPTDEAERLRAELAATREALRVSEDRFRKAFLSSPDAISLTRARDGKMIDANEGFTKITGWTRDEVVGRTTVDLDLWVDPEVRGEMTRRLTAQGFVDELETEFRRRDGSIVHGSFSARVIDYDGEPHLISVARDITEKRALEAQLQHAQKMEAVGRLASGLAHDFNNLLTVIRGYTRVLAGAGDDPELLEEAVEEIDAASVRAADLTRQLLAFARRQVLLPRNLDLNAQLRNLHRMLGRLLPEPIDLLVEADAQAGTIRMDPGQLAQVVTNLVVNARDAMPEGGTLLLRTRAVQTGEAAGGGLGPGHGGGAPTRWTVLDVIDEGVGIDETMREEIFEPFFTTKALDEGTGLGLSTVDGIMSQSGGFVEVDSEVGKGTRMSLHWPTVHAAPDHDDRPSTGGRALRGGERILLVEDAPTLRNLLVRVLQAEGAEVSAAADVESALALAERDDGFDAVVTDLVMPDGNGVELVERLRDARPALPVLFITGYVDPEVGAKMPRDAHTRLLHKAFTPSEFLRAVAELLR